MKLSLDLPRINPQSPYCVHGVMEGIAKYAFRIPNLNRLYSHHTFVYKRQSGPPEVSGDALGADLTRENAGDFRAKHHAAAEFHYGLEVKAILIHDPQELIDTVVHHLERNQPLACDFNFGFMNKRKEYGKKFEIHQVLISGIDSDSREIIAKSQYLETFAIPAIDWIGAMEYHRKIFDGFRVYLLKKTKEGRPLSPDIVAERIEANLRNLSSERADLGISGLTRMAEDLESILQRKGIRPFSIPGIWVFGNERFAVNNWIGEIRDARLGIGNDGLDEMGRLCFALGNKWTMLSWMIEHALESGDAKLWLRAIGMLKDILNLERACVGAWDRLGAQVRRRARA